MIIYESSSISLMDVFCGSQDFLKLQHSTLNLLRKIICQQGADRTHLTLILVELLLELVTRAIKLGLFNLKQLEGRVASQRLFQRPLSCSLCLDYSLCHLRLPYQQFLGMLRLPHSLIEILLVLATAGVGWRPLLLLVWIILCIEELSDLIAVVSNINWYFRHRSLVTTFKNIAFRGPSNSGVKQELAVTILSIWWDLPGNKRLLPG